RLVHDRAIGERAAAENGGEERAVGAMRAALGAQVRRATARIAATARRARSARRAPRDDDTVPWSNERHLRPHFLDDARALVAEQNRQLQPPPARLDHVDVRMAEPA